LAAQQHYVSKFHLKMFLDPDSSMHKDPWVWQGFIGNGTVRKRAPKNVGTSAGLFDGCGGLSDEHNTIETFLANEIEGPAAAAMRGLRDCPPGSIDQIPPALARYLAWAAARSLPMQALENLWGERGFGQQPEMIEPPPEALLDAAELRRDVQMVHPTLGRRLFPAGTDFEKPVGEGWFPDMQDRTNFLEGVHIQAYYFQVRFFPRLKWYALHTPPGSFFIIADRPVGWVADGYFDAPPSSLRHPSAYLLAPVSKDLCLVGRHTAEPWIVTPAHVNAVIATWAQEWIVGSAEATVASALADRQLILGSGGMIQ
jgi:hypothetical protein